MLKRIIIFMVWSPFVWGQYEQAYTNKPVPYSSTILIPRAAVPQAGVVPQATSVEIPVAGVPQPPVSSAPASLNSPFKPAAAIPHPTTSDLARRRVQVVAPPLPALTPVTQVPLPVNVAAPAVVVDNHRYVAPNGLDTDAGTQDKPWRTIQHAAEQAKPGDIVVVRAGIYEPFHTMRSGTAEKPIIFQAEANVIVGPPGGLRPSEKTAKTLAELYRLDNIHVRFCDYIIIEGFQVQRAARCGICVVDSRGVVLRNNIVSDARVFGILTGFAVEVQILNNKTFGTLEQHGIYVSNSRSERNNPVIRGNESYANNYTGIQVNGDCKSGGNGSITGAIIENNIIHDNSSKGMSLISMSDSIVQNNLIYNNGKTSGAGGIHLTDEKDCGRPSSGNVIVNNTIDEPNITGIRLTDGAVDNIIFNNLLISPRPLVDEVKDNKIDTLSNVKLQSNAGVFVNPLLGDYRLIAGSPAKSLGLPVYYMRVAPLTDCTGQRRKNATGINAGAY
ncbi:MAG: NosD domain-containing protein [Verrucomicrobiota bacterium]